ncbi:sperm flagellar protein 1 [Clupea harengus]|uniref:Sperm flagellar protein 1 n=1 Tax=Clupea harengus TaxID=7950 RepID=A0A6P8G5N1_CLUHA|nr:sperm flagellar protein 1 [Clupea harengus]
MLMSPCGFRKVFSKLSFHVPAEVVRKIVMSTAGFIEPVLCTLRERIESKRMDRVSDNMQQVEYYSISHDQAHKENGDVVSESDQTKDMRMRKTKDRPAVRVLLGPDVDPSIRLMMEEKEQALLTLRETVEILQIKVNRLEHLIQLKDLRIEDLTKHLERHKTRAQLS